MSEDELIAALSEESGEAAPSTGEGFSSPLEALAAENARQEEEIKELKDRMLRTAAEMENLRRRTQKDVADARDFSISKFARDVLGVADNLRRALEHVPDEEKDQPGLKSLAEGVEMTERELLSALEKNGVKKVDPKGEKFNPNFHQAMFEVPNTEVPNNTVVQVVQVGYVIGERVLRPAMVGVSKGGPKVAPVQPQEQGGEDG
ncbi:MAG: nucleotide exchange factor GrpE [Pseudomonadota bacterium]